MVVLGNSCMFWNEWKHFPPPSWTQSAGQWHRTTCLESGERTWVRFSPSLGQNPNYSQKFCLQAPLSTQIKGERGSHCLVAANQVQCLNFWLPLLRLDAPGVKDGREEPEKQMQQTNEQNLDRWSKMMERQFSGTSLANLSDCPEACLSAWIYFELPRWIYVLAALLTYPLWWWWHFRIWTQWVTFETLQTFDQGEVWTKRKKCKKAKTNKKV